MTICMWSVGVSWVSHASKHTSINKKDSNALPYHND
jgi:hypothetical protein